MKKILASLLLLPLALLLLPQAHVSAQGNNMDIYRKLLNQNKQKNWKRRDAEAPMIDVDAIVRREDAQRRRQQQTRQPRTRQQSRCVEGARLSDTGCGTYGIHPCFCVNGTAQWR